MPANLVQGILARYQISSLLDFLKQPGVLFVTRMSTAPPDR
jgi:hypothetical protein